MTRKKKRVCVVGIPRQGYSLREGFDRQLASASCRGREERSPGDLTVPSS